MPLELTLPLLWILNIALLSMVSAKRKNGKILKTLNKYHKNEFIKYDE